MPVEACLWGAFVCVSRGGCMQYNIQYVTDKYGNCVFVQIPVAQWELIRAQLPDMVEQDRATGRAEVVDRQGILVVRSKAVRDITNAVKEERERCVTQLIGKIQE